MSATSKYLGVDIAKASFQVDLLGNNVSFPNTRSGHVKLISQVRKIPEAVVVVEATGGYETALMQALHHAHLPVARVPPGLVRHHKYSKRVYAKTDKIDARMISSYGAAEHPPLTPPRSAAHQELVNQSRHRQQLVELAASVKNQQHLQTEVFCRKQEKKLLVFLAKQIEDLDVHLATLVVQVPALAERAALLRRQKGIGMIIAIVLLAEMPELGTLNRQQAGALSGTAPFTRESGQFQGKRRIAGGRGRVRRALYLCALTAMRHDPVMRALYLKLRAGNGPDGKPKPKKVAMVAVMRHLVVHLNSVLKGCTTPLA